MGRTSSVVRKISLDTASSILKGLRSGSLEKLGRTHGIENFNTIPKLIRRAFERAGKKAPRSVRQIASKGASPATVKVTRKGTIVVPKRAVVEAFGFQNGQRFSARRHGERIILTALGRASGRRKA